MAAPAEREVSGGAKATRKEPYIPQSEADFVRKTVERMQRGVSHEMIGLRDRCREPFALFVSNSVSTEDHVGKN